MARNTTHHVVKQSRPKVWLASVVVLTHGGGRTP